MDPTWQGVLYLFAVVLFLFAGLMPALIGRKPLPPMVRVSFIALGLAFVAFVFMWNAFAAA